MKLQSLTIIFIIILLPVTLVLSAYIGYELKTIEKQNLYNTGIISATHDAIFSFEINTKNEEYSNNPESKRDILKAAVKTFENSFSTTCNLGLYGNDKIEEYIPAMVFGMYDGFYMYAPYETKENGYKHDLRNYVYYSETLPGDIIIRYSLDNYITVSGRYNGNFISRAGYLTNLNDFTGNQYTGLQYKGVSINNSDPDAYNYFMKSYDFTNWFLNDAKIGDKASYLKIDSTNDPEDENSAFVQHKRKIMKEKIQSVLNSSITSYAAKTGKTYKMPVFTEEEWNKIYTNISVTTFVQGMNLGFKKYNGYCVLNSTNSNEYVNPNLLYFIYDGEYHNIRCNKLQEATDDNSIVGFKIADFEKMTAELTDNDTEETTKRYYYKHNELACYECINGLSDRNIENENFKISIYDYVRDDNIDIKIRKAYFLALARERYKTKKLSDVLNVN